MSTSTKNRGIAFVVSAPSGAGKSTIIRRVMASDGQLRFSVSCTTRPSRPGEVDGRDYHFLEDEVFQEHVDAGDFLEHARFSGNQYGTLRSDLEEVLAEGKDVILEIEIKGAEQIRQVVAAGDFDEHVVFVFIVPPSMEELERRLRARGTETESNVRRRLCAAAREWKEQGKYDHVIVNDDLNRAVAEFQEMVSREREKIGRG